MQSSDQKTFGDSANKVATPDKAAVVTETTSKATTEPPSAAANVASNTASPSAPASAGPAAASSSQIKAELMRHMGSPKVENINFATRRAGSKELEFKSMTIEELSKFMNREIQWTETVVWEESERKSFPTLKLPKKTAKELQAIFKLVAETIKNLALIDLNAAMRFSPIATKEFATNSAFLLYAGKYGPFQCESFYSETVTQDKNGNTEFSIDSAFHTGFCGFMPDAPIQKSDPGCPEFLAVDSYKFKKKAMQNKLSVCNMVCVEEFTVNNIPFRLFTNCIPITKYGVLSQAYGRDYFRGHDIIPRICNADGTLVDASVYHAKQIQIAFYLPDDKKVARTITYDQRMGLETIKFDLVKGHIVFITKKGAERLRNKYPPNSPFMRATVEDLIVVKLANNPNSQFHSAQTADSKKDVAGEANVDCNSSQRVTPQKSRP